LQSALRTVQSETATLTRTGQDVADLNQADLISNAIPRYTGRCSNIQDISCSSIRSNLERAGDRLYQDGSQVREADQELRTSSRSIQQAVQGANSIPAVDVNGTLNRQIDQMLPSLQNAYNYVSEAARLARAASQDESGTGFDAKAKQALQNLQQASSYSSTGLSGLNDLISTAQSLENQLSSGAASAAVQGLRQASLDLTSAQRSATNVAQRLVGFNSLRGGDLNDAEDALNQHRRICETSSF